MGNNRGDLRKLDQEARDDLLKKELSIEKLKIIEKFGLESTQNLFWVSRRENSHEQMILRHSYLVKNDILRILFRINKLCFAKVNYFSKNIEKFEPQIYDYENGFKETELWNAEFLKHLASRKIIDLRYLQTITDIEIFRELCFYLESLEEVL